jgi:hypothetical protein
MAGGKGGRDDIYTVTQRSVSQLVKSRPERQSGLRLLGLVEQKGFPSVSSPSGKSATVTAILPFSAARAPETPNPCDLRVKGETRQTWFFFVAVE